MRVLILGAGGIGGYFGGRLVEAGADVTFLVRASRTALLKAGGLRIDSPLGDARIAVRTIETAEAPYDLVILSCKAYDLAEAIAVVRPAVGPETSVLPLLNGLAQLDALDAVFGAMSVLGGSAFISAALAEDGTVRHLSELQGLTLGARSEEQETRCNSIATLLRTASFDTRLSRNIMQEMWEKFTFITAAAAITCLMRAPIGAIMDTVEGERLIRQMLTECQAVAVASGYPVSPKARDWSSTLLTERGSKFTASMLRDLESGGRIEADHLQGDMIRRGTTLSVPTDLLKVAYCHLQTYENLAR